MIENHAELLAGLADLDPPVYLFGGVAEDVLLHGHLSRPHGDVDVFVLRQDLPGRMKQFADLGFDNFELRYAPRPGQPLALGCPRGQTDLELGVFDTAGSDVYFEVEDESGVIQRVFLPPDALVNDEPTNVDGVPVWTLSPLSLVHIRRGLELLGTFGSLREKDIAIQAKLLERFFGGSLPSEPRIEQSRS